MISQSDDQLKEHKQLGEKRLEESNTIRNELVNFTIYTVRLSEDTKFEKYEINNIFTKELITNRLSSPHKLHTIQLPLLLQKKIQNS